MPRARLIPVPLKVTPQPLFLKDCDIIFSFLSAHQCKGNPIPDLAFFPGVLLQMPRGEASAKGGTIDQQDTECKCLRLNEKIWIFKIV
jgi:hypothetical protein